MQNKEKRTKFGFLRGLSGQIICACLLATAPTLAFAQDVDPPHAHTGKYLAFEAWRHRVELFSSIIGAHDTLKQYADKCAVATEIRVPSFSCGDGVEVPGQGTIPQTDPPSTRCDHPNVLNGVCDPGSRFQVLPGGTADAVTVAHCRKNGKPIADTNYNDIAVIQYNKRNGALCFYQALTNLPGQNIPSPGQPDQGIPANRHTDGAAWSDGKAHWITPEGTEGIGCTGCHDNGGFIRSEYLAQLKTPPNVLPNQATGFDNLNTPSRYVGLDYATNRSWSIKTDLAPGDPGLSCTTCHRLAVPNRQAFGQINGTAAHFANVATAEDQCVQGKCSKTHPHSDVSPIWMRPGQTHYNALAEASATRYHDCAVGFFNSGFTTAPPGCNITPLGEPFLGVVATTDLLALLRDNGEIWRYIGPPCTTTTSCPGWILIDSGIGRPIQIAAQPSGSMLFQRHEDGSIWKWDGSSHCDAAGKACPGWARINNDARTKDIVASGSTVFQRLADGSVWKWDGKSPCDAAGKVCPGWTRINTDPHTAQIGAWAAGLSSGTLFMRQDNGALWTWDGNSHCDAAGKVCPGWTRINNDARTKEFTAGGDASVGGPQLYQRLADGSVWKWDGKSHCDAAGKVCPGWTRINTDPHTAQIAAGEFYPLFMRQDNGAIWKWDGSSHCDVSGKVCPGWTRINNDARTRDIVASGSTVFQRLADGSVWKWDGNSPCDAAGNVCPGWAPPLDTDPHAKAIVSLGTAP